MVQGAWRTYVYSASENRNKTVSEQPHKWNRLLLLQLRAIRKTIRLLLFRGTGQRPDTPPA